MLGKPLLSYLLVLAILLSLFLFLFAPNYEFIPRVTLMLIAVALSIWNAVLRQRGSAVIFGLAAISISLTIFQLTWIKEIDIAFLVTWTLIVVIMQKRRNSL